MVGIAGARVAGVQHQRFGGQLRRVTGAPAAGARPATPHQPILDQHPLDNGRASCESARSPHQCARPERFDRCRVSLRQPSSSSAVMAAQAGSVPAARQQGRGGKPMPAGLRPRPMRRGVVAGLANAPAAHWRVIEVRPASVSARPAPLQQHPPNSSSNCWILPDHGGARCQAFGGAVKFRVSPSTGNKQVRSSIGFSHT